MPTSWSDATHAPARLVRNKRGIYEIRWTVAGRSHRKSTRCREQQAAAVALAEWLRFEGRGLARGPEDMRLDDVLHYYAKGHLQARTAAPERGEIAIKHLTKGLGMLAVSTLTDAAVLDYRRKRAVTDSTLRRELGVLRAALRYAVQERLLRPDLLPTLRLPDESPPRARWLDEGQVAVLWDWVERRLWLDHADRLAWFTAFALETGARKRAIELLPWMLVDRGAGAVHYDRVPGLVVNKHKRRVPVPISGRLEQVLRWHAPRPDDPRSQGLVLGHAGCVRDAFKRAVAAELGVQGVTPHVLRHTFATLRLRAGVSLWVVARLLGDTVATVEQTYGHHAMAHLQEGVDAVGVAKPKLKLVG